MQNDGFDRELHAWSKSVWAFGMIHSSLFEWVEHDVSLYLAAKTKFTLLFSLFFSSVASMFDLSSAFA